MMCAYEVSSDIGVEPNVIPNLHCDATFFPRLPWWEECTVAHWNGVILTRKKIILMLADEDGGAHIDANISEELILLKRKCIQSPKLCFNFVDGTKKSYVVDTEKALYAIVRTIGAEVIETISPYLERI